MLNVMVVQGRLTSDPEIRYVGEDQTPIVNFSIACDRDYVNKQTGERETDFLDVVAKRQSAEFIHNFFTKGRLIILEGRFQQRRWKADDGTNRSKIELVVANNYFSDSKKAEANGEEGETASTPPSPLPGGFTPNFGNESGGPVGDEDDDGNPPF